MRAVEGSIPIAPLFDFAAAFPSLAHAFVFSVAERIGMPGGMIEFIKAIYFFNCTFGDIAGVTVFLFMFGSGVLQG